MNCYFVVKIAVMIINVIFILHLEKYICILIHWISLDFIDSILFGFFICSSNSQYPGHSIRIVWISCNQSNFWLLVLHTMSSPRTRRVLKDLKAKDDNNVSHLNSNSIYNHYTTLLLIFFQQRFTNTIYFIFKQKSLKRKIFYFLFQVMLWV